MNTQLKDSLNIMKAKQLIVLLSILGLLILLAIWQKREIMFKSEKLAGESALLFADFDPQRAGRIQLTGPDIEHILIKQDGKWRVATASGLPASGEYVNQLLSQTGGINKGDLVSRQPEKFGIFQADESGLTVKIADEQQKLMAHFYLGKQGPDFNSRYLRKAGSNDVFLINRSLRTTFDREDWRERQAFGFNAQEVVGLDLAYDEQQFALIKEGDTWRLTQPEAAAAQQKTVAAILGSLGRLWILEFVLEEEAAAQHGLDKPVVKLKLGLADGSSQVLLLGDKNTDGSAYYAQREGEAYIFTLPVNQVENIKKKLPDLKEQEPDEARLAPEEEKSESAKE